MIDKFQGDAVMAVFGAPIRSPITRNARSGCAIAMQHRQSELNEEGWGTAALEALHRSRREYRAGDRGRRRRRRPLEYTVIGDAVNVAQRLQSEAAGGEVVASAATIAAADGIAASRSAREPSRDARSRWDVFRVLLSDGSSP
jgi:adenylate cyclase